jgi:hypothetical protein
MRLPILAAGLVVLGAVLYETLTRTSLAAPHLGGGAWSD